MELIFMLDMLAAILYLDWKWTQYKREKAKWKRNKVSRHGSLQMALLKAKEDIRWTA